MDLHDELEASGHSADLQADYEAQLQRILVLDNLIKEQVASSATAVLPPLSKTPLERSTERSGT